MDGPRNQEILSCGYEMEHRHRELLKDKHTYLVSHLSVCPVFLAHFYSARLLNDDEYDVFMQDNVTRSRKAAQLCLMLVRKGPRAFSELLKALELSNQEFIKEALLSSLRAEPQLTLAPCDGDILMESCGDYQKALVIAVERGRHEALCFLMAKNVNIWITDEVGQTLLHQGAKGGHTRIIKTLLWKGLDVNSLDQRHRSCLHISIIAGQPGTTIHLINDGRANIRLFDVCHQDPLHLCCSHGDEISARLLLERGADPTNASFGGRTALHAACRGGFYSIAEMLLDHMQNIDRAVSSVSCSGKNQTVHPDAACGKRLIDREDEYGCTPLHWACEYGDADTALLLLRRGSLIQTRSRDGSTPLHEAAENGLLPVVRALLQAGADPLLRDDTGHTPRDRALMRMRDNDPERDYDGVVALLPDR